MRLPTWAMAIIMPLCMGTVAAAANAEASSGQAQPETISFRPMDEIESKYIYRNLGSQEIPEERTRFQDKKAYIIYRFAFDKNSAAALTMHVSAQFKVELSKDCKTFDTAAVYTSSKGDPLHLDLTPYINTDGFVYVKIGDAKPDDGWGGKIHDISVSGRFRNVPIERIGNITPIFLGARTGLYAKLSPPGRHLYHFAAHGASPAEAILFRSLQGLVNRENNELLVADDHWRMIPELQKQHLADEVTEIPDAAALFKRYPKREAVVYDPDCYGTENLAIMIGSMEGLVAAHPDLVEKYGLHIKEDLRHRWKTTLDGYKEVYARYKGRFNRETMVMAAPSKRPDLYDYAVANRCFTFWIVGGTDANRKGANLWAEEEWFERTLSQDFPVNIPILGYPQVEPEDGIGENRGVALFSRCGKFLVPADHMPNMSVLSAYPHAWGKVKVQRPAALALNKSKVYISMVLSDGDNQCLWNGPDAFMFNYMRSMKASGPRQFSVSYTMGPSIVDLNPLAASLVDEYLEPQDSIGGAVSGVGYMYMSGYANNFGKDRGKVVAEFSELTSAYLEHAGERWDWIMDYGGPGSARLKDYAKISGCVALMGGYGREATIPAKTAEEVGSMVAFHSVSRMTDKNGVLADIKHVTDTGVRPLFLDVFIFNWGINPSQYRELAQTLMASGVEIVTPETLADLYHQAQ